MNTENQQYVVIGEAPESDSDEEVNVPVTVSALKKQNITTTNPQGIVIAGEAPESDEEEKGSVSSISSATSISSTISFSSNPKRNRNPDKEKAENVQYNSLLHRKLRERSIALHRNIVDFVHHNVGLAARDLYGANQQLLKSQLQLQEVALSLHALHSNLNQLQKKLASASSLSFLSHINVSQHSVL